MGGAWERMVGLGRRVLGAIIPGKPMDDDALPTLLVNSLPLTDVSVDDDSYLPRTPLLPINLSIGLSPIPTDRSDVYYEAMHHRQTWAAEQNFTGGGGTA